MINFSGTENINNLIELEKVSIMSILDIQKNFNKQILIFVKKFMTNINLSFNSDINDKTSFYLNKSTNCLNKSNSNINVLKDLLNLLNSINPTDKNLAEKITDYNNTFKDYLNSVHTNTESIEKFVHEITITDFSELPNTPTDSNLIEQPTSIRYNQNTYTQYIENTLIISENQKKVILPYTINEIENILQKKKHFNSIEDVIDKFYTKPINYYKCSPIARFKETYKLVKEKEKGSTFKALGLALELLGNYSLHPAIITACNSLDELDIYLACLEDNTLDDFHFFDIKYEIPLALSKLTTVSNLGISRLAKNNNI